MLFRCKRCLYPNTKPDLHFNAEGVCSACQAFDARQKIDWKAKEAEFLDYVRSHPGDTHDVIVAVSGGKDSTWQVVKCLELGLRPLAVCATTDHLSTIGRRNLDNIAELCDLVEITVHKPTRRKIARFALEEMGDLSWAEHQLIWSIPARASIERKIPVVLYGECQNNCYGAGAKGTENTSRLTRDWIDEYGGLLGLRISDVSDILGIDMAQLELYRYPVDDAEHIHSLFMGAYFEWNGLRNAEVAWQHGFRSFHTRVEGSLVDYENLDNLATGPRDLLRFYKFGYSRACDIASTYIRHGRMTRDGAAGIVNMIERKPPTTYLGVSYDEILAPFGVTEKQFAEIAERFTNREVVEWASSPASYQSFYSTSTDASKESSSTQAAA